jgi:hypothetical protein
MLSGCIMGFFIAVNGFDSVQLHNFKKIVILRFSSLQSAVSIAETPYQRAFYMLSVDLNIGLDIETFLCFVQSKQ